MAAMRSKIPVKAENLSAASRRSYGVPRNWQDEKLQCRQCGTSFVFTADQQREWYECKKSHICQQPVLCPACFWDYSRRRQLKSRMDYALRKVKQQLDPTVEMKLEAAQTIVDYYQSERRGNLPLAIQLLRQVLSTQEDHRQASELVALAVALSSK